MNLRSLIGKAAYKLMKNGYYETVGKAAKVLWQVFREKGIDPIEDLLALPMRRLSFDPIVKRILGLDFTSKALAMYEKVLDVVGNLFPWIAPETNQLAYQLAHA